jgi:hypothetical protein
VATQQEAERELVVPYPKALKRFPTIRQSWLSSFDDCGLTNYFDLTYRKGWSTSYQARGQIFHRFAAECLRTMAGLSEDSIPVDAALGILRDVMRQDDVDRRCPGCGSENLMLGMSNDGKRRCRDCKHEFETDLVNLSEDSARSLYWTAIKWAHDNAFDIQNLVDVEKRAEATIYYPNRDLGGMVPRRLTGQIDALFIDDAGTAIVIDWKDMWSLPPAHEPGEDDEVSFKGYFQQRFYAWLIFKQPEYHFVQRVTLREFYVRYSQPREATVTRADEAEIEGELAALAERFDRQWDEQLRLRRNSRRTAFRPTPGKHCGFCILPTSCPIPAPARDEGRITTAEEAELEARRLLVSERIVKQARGALQTYGELNGPIPIRDAKGKRVLGFMPAQRTERPSLEQVEAAEREKGGPLSSAELKALYKTKDGTRWGKFVPKEMTVPPGLSDEEIAEALEASIEAARESRDRLADEGPSNVVSLDSVRRPA